MCIKPRDRRVKIKSLLKKKAFENQTTDTKKKTIDRKERREKKKEKEQKAENEEKRKKKKKSKKMKKE